MFVAFLLSMVDGFPLSALLVEVNEALFEI